MGIFGQAVAVLARALLLLRRLVRLLRDTLVNGWDHRILGLSAEAAFWQLLSLPSLFLALIATLGFAGRWVGASTVDRADERLIATIGRAFSDEVTQQVVRPVIDEVLRSQRFEIVSLGFVLALWAGSSATATFVNTITIAYGMRDRRGAVRSRLLALGLFLASMAIGVVVMPLLVLGPTLLVQIFPATAQDTARQVIDGAYYPVVVLILVLGLTTLYRLAPPTRLPWRRVVPGAVLAVVVFLAGSSGLRGYIRLILDHNRAYGTLAAPIAALLFFYVLALGVLLGAEFNAAVQVAHPAPERVPLRRGWVALPTYGPDLPATLAHRRGSYFGNDA